MPRRTLDVFQHDQRESFLFFCTGAVGTVVDVVCVESHLLWTKARENKVVSLVYCLVACLLSCLRVYRVIKKTPPYVGALCSALYE